MEVPETDGPETNGAESDGTDVWRMTDVTEMLSHDGLYPPLSRLSSSGKSASATRIGLDRLVYG